MTESPNNCPTPEQLKALLDGSMTEPEQVVMQSHVDGCSACQQTLESLVVGTESWDAAVGHLRYEAAQPEAANLSDAIRQLKADEFVEGSAREGATSTRPLDFLEPSDQPGSLGRLGSYEVSEVVGQGGMGVVLKAFDPSLHRVVAVKVLAPYLAHNPQARKRFIREAQAIAAVSHDHVITIHAIDESVEQPKIVMQFIAGRSLQEKLDAEGSLDLKEVLRIGMQTASGLAAAHAQGLVHRDVKPSNILLENGIQRVKLTDFGLARAVDDASLTQSGVIAGTPQYMAPEQANGDAVDHRADLFSLGSVMYAMCVGHSPFRASTTMGVLKRVCHDPPRPIQELNPDIPDWLCAIIMQLLAKRREDRFQTAKTVAEVLEKWLAHVQQPSVVPKPSFIDSPPTQQTQRYESFGGQPSSIVSLDSRPESQTPNRDASTILFQSISGRPLLFFLLTGTAVSFAFAQTQRMGTEEALLMSVLGGMAITFWGLLFVSLIRLIWANVSGTFQSSASSPNESSSGSDRPTGFRSRSQWSLPPESLAMLAALLTMVLGGHVLWAAIVAIVVWRLAIRWPLTENPFLAGMATRVEPDSPRDAGTENQSFAARVNSVLNTSRRGLHHLGKAISRMSGLEPAALRRLLIVIAWCVTGVIDLMMAAVFGIVLLREPRRDAPLVFLFAVISLAMSLVSLAVAHGIHVRQNFHLVRGGSILGLLPVSYGAILRIPLGIITLLWQRAPSVKETFATTPWSETDLGQLVVGGLSQTMQRWLRTLGRLAVWSVLCLILLLLTLAGYVIPFGPSDYRVDDESAVNVTLKGESPPVRFSLRASGSGHTYGLLPPNHVYRLDTLQLSAADAPPSAASLATVRLGFPTTIQKNGLTREFTKEDCREFFQTISGRPHPQPADSLFQAIQWINSTHGSHPKSAHTAAEQFRSSVATSIPEWLNLLRRTFLYAEPLHANRPLPGFTATSTLLNQELFVVRPDAERHVSNSCMTTPWLLITLLIGFPLMWLLGAWRIVRRRHVEPKALGSPSPSTAPA